MNGVYRTNIRRGLATVATGLLVLLLVASAALARPIGPGATTGRGKSIVHRHRVVHRRRRRSHHAARVARAARGRSHRKAKPAYPGGPGAGPGGRAGAGGGSGAGGSGGSGSGSGAGGSGSGSGSGAGGSGAGGSGSGSGSGAGGSGSGGSGSGGPPPPSGLLTFNGSFSNGFAPWTTGGGGPQCANTGTPSKYPRLRGTINFDTSVVGTGTASGEFTLPADPDPTTYPLEACDVSPAGKSMDLGTDGYYGIMVYVPTGWTIANSAFYGVEFMEYHFQNIYGAPISFQLHPDHVTLALQTGACSNYATAQPGCTYHSNADNPNGDPGNLPAYYVVPPGAFQQGAWNELLMHVHWASDGTGQIETWYRVKGAGTWTPSASVNGIPTVQWDMTKGCCFGTWSDDAEAYTAALSAPLSLWLDNQVSGTTFAAVAATMP